MKVITRLLPIVLLLPGCTRRHEGRIEEKRIEYIEGQIRATYRDPESVRFQNVQLFKEVVPTAIPPIPISVSLCGTVNAKNGFGGYIGYRRFWATWMIDDSGELKSGPDTHWVNVDDERNDSYAPLKQSFEESYRDTCRNVTLPPPDTELPGPRGKHEVRGRNAKEKLDANVTAHNALLKQIEAAVRRDDYGKASDIILERRKQILDDELDAVRSLNYFQDDRDKLLDAFRHESKWLDQEDDSLLQDSIQRHKRTGNGK